MCTSQSTLQTIVVILCLWQNYSIKYLSEWVNWRQCDYKAALHFSNTKSHNTSLVMRALWGRMKMPPWLKILSTGALIKGYCSIYFLLLQVWFYCIAAFILFSCTWNTPLYYYIITILIPCTFNGRYLFFKFSNFQCKLTVHWKVKLTSSKWVASRSSQRSSASRTTVFMLTSVANSSNTKNALHMLLALSGW